MNTCDGLSVWSCSQGALSTIVGLAALATASAEEGITPAFSETDFLQTPPVVLSVTQLAQPPAETPAAVTVITREEIAAMGARTIPEILRRIPGVVVAYENITNPVVTYQGLNTGLSRRMQVLIDGRSVLNPFFGGVFWEALPVAVEDIERIEFIRGTNAPIDGANAFLATISIFTRHAAEDQGSYAQGWVGNNGIREGYLRHGDTQGDLSYRLSANYREDHGLDTRDDDLQSQTVSARLDWNLTPKQRLTMQAGFKDADLGQGYDTTRFVFRENPFEACFPTHTRHLSDGFGQLRYDYTPSADRQTTVQFYYERFTSLAEYWLIAPCPSLARKKDDYVTERFDLELRDSRPLGNQARLITGLGGRLDTIDNRESTGEITFRNRYRSRSVRLFGHLEYRFNTQWLLNFGGMLERHTLTGDTEISPRLALHYTFAPQHTLRFGIARGIRNPSFVEQEWNTPAYASSGRREAESLIAGEVGYLGVFPAWGISVDGRVFWNRVTDLIGDDPTTLLIDYQNAGEVDLRGIEWQFIWQPRSSTRVALAYAYTDIDSNDPLGIDYAATQPRHVADLWITHDFDEDWQGSVAFNYASGMEWLTFGSEVPATRFLDLRLARQLTIDGRVGLIALKFENILDEQVTYRDINRWDRRVFLELAIGF